MIRIDLLAKKDNWPGVIPPYCAWFEEAWRKAGGGVRKNPVPRLIRGCAMKLGVIGSSEKFRSKRKALFYFGSCYPDTGVFPFQNRYEIVPYLIDTWPEYWPRLFRFIKRNQTRLIFVSQSQMRPEIQTRFTGMQVFHIPEGVSISGYRNEKKLCNRVIDLLELGRRHSETHDRICRAKIKGLRVHIFQDGQLCFPNQEALVDGLSETKIAICWPQSFTHSEMSGRIETLTLRYWEMMLSRVVMMGKVPQELVDLIGFNPVIDLAPEHAPQQIEAVLAQIESYQPMVDANYQAALKYGSWGVRIEKIQRILNSNGYVMKQ